MNNFPQSNKTFVISLSVELFSWLDKKQSEQNKKKKC